MPIRPENKARYPGDWKTISHRIRFDRAQGRCECAGECGTPGCGPERCTAIHGAPNAWSGKNVVLTTAHLNHTPEDVRDANLKAMCQRCHLAYDRDHHAQTRAASRRTQLDADMDSLFDQQAESADPADSDGKVNGKAPAMCPASGGATHPQLKDR